MTDTELTEMILMLQTHSQIGRLNLAECRDVFRVLQVKGYTVTKPDAVAAPVEAVA